MIKDYLLNLVNYNSKSTPIIGYIFYPDNVQNPMRTYSTEELIKNNTREPPWIVIHHHIEKVGNLKWPGHLYEAEVIDAVTDREMEIFASKLLPDAGYTRSVAIRILKKLDPALLFGSNGKAICNLLNWIAEMNYQQAEELGKNISPQAAGLYNKAWDAWLITLAPDSYHLGHDHRDVIAIPTKRHNPDSPINKGFMVISDLLHKRAHQVSGEAAMVLVERNEDDYVDDWDNEPEQGLAPVWSNALDALLYTAMGMGAQQWISESECDLLMSAWLNTTKKNN